MKLFTFRYTILATTCAQYFIEFSFASKNTKINELIQNIFLILSKISYIYTA